MTWHIQEGLTILILFCSQNCNYGEPTITHTIDALTRNNRTITTTTITVYNQNSPHQRGANLPPNWILA